jgi:hypothetical protein
LTNALLKAAGRGILPTAMFQAHSFLWHYLWAAPNLLLLILGFLMWKRGIVNQYPAFFAFATLSAVSELIVYAADISPRVDAWTFWRVDWVGLLFVALLKFVLVGEIFGHVFGGYASVARLGRVLIRTVGVGLVLSAAILAAYAPQNSRFKIISEAHVLSQAIFLIESGLLVFIFLFSFYFRLIWERGLFGIAIGLTMSSCIHLATLALIASGQLSEHGKLLATFLNMATYHLSVLIWMYFLLVPKKKLDPKPPGPLPHHELEVLNEELERLIHQ